MANESYNPYSQQIEQNKLPWYISETFINSVEIRSPFIAGNKWYIWWTLQVWQNWIVIDWSQKIIRSINYKENESWWIIKWNWDSEFNNITVRWNILWWKTSYSDSIAWYWLWLDWWVPKFNLWNSTNSLKWDWTQLNIKGNIEAATFKWSLLYDSISAPSLEQWRTWCEWTKDVNWNIVSSQKVLHWYFWWLPVKQQISTNAMVLDEILSLTNNWWIDLYQWFNLYHWFKPRFIECNISFRNLSWTVQWISIWKYNIINWESNFIFYQNSWIHLSWSSSWSWFKIWWNALLPSNRDIEVIVDSTDDYQTVIELKCKPWFQITWKFYLIW